MAVAWLAVAMACGLDWLVGDPRRCLHPVEVMGWAIARLRWLAEAWARDNPLKLQLCGVLITALVVGSSGLAGWGLEQAARTAEGPWLAIARAALVGGLASALAAKSLEQGVQRVLNQLNGGELAVARSQLGLIVGRDTNGLETPEILRALAETASENGVDGLFAPLFWMLLGAALWGLNPNAPGPLCLAWSFKAASTLDSMLGYRQGRLRWLGTAGARLDDLLVWLPCRLVALSMPLAADRSPLLCWQTLQQACHEGAADPSPNAGVSQAAYALTARVQLGGSNRYGGELKHKPILAAGQPAADAAAVQRLLLLNRRLQLIWLGGSGLIAAVGALAAFITKTLSPLPKG